MNYFVVTILNYLESPLTWLWFIVGLCVGSFLNVCIYRIPEKTFFKDLRSKCLNCGQTIPFYLNIPLLSYLMLGGKAKCCGAKLSWQYPLVELTTGVLFVLIYWKTPFIYIHPEGAIAFQHTDIIRFSHALLLACALLISSVIDLRLMIIPDEISLSLLLMTPLVVYLHPDLTWQSAVFGVFLGGGILYAIAWLYWFIRKEIGLGFGDVKLMAALGGWLGYQAVIPTIFIGSLIGAMIGISAMVLTRRLTLKTAIPFGPFLALGAFIYLMMGTEFQEWLLMR